MSIGDFLKYPLVGEDTSMRSELLYILGRKSKNLHLGRDSLFAAVYEQVMLPDHVRESFLRGYMLNYISLEWDEIQVCAIVLSNL